MTITKEEAIKRLKQVKKLVFDQQEAHQKADDILLELAGEEVKKIWKEVEEAVGGFWYS